MAQTLSESRPSPALTEIKKHMGIERRAGGWLIRLVSHSAPAGKTLALTAMVASVAYLDHLTGPNVSLAVLYMIPICLATLWLGRGAGLTFCFIATGTWFCVDWFEHDYATRTVPLWNAGVRAILFCFVTELLHRVLQANRHLEAKVREQTEALTKQLERNRQMEYESSLVADRERTRLAHDLHDGIGQELAALGFKAKIIEQDITAGTLPEARHATELLAMLKQCLVDLRHLARGIDPLVIETGLDGALEDLARRTTQAFDIPCSVDATMDNRRPTHRVATDLYRICQEAVTNAVKHGKPARIDITLTLSQSNLLLTIRDDGKGFDVDNGTSSGMGLAIMKHRAQVIGLKLTVRSSPGNGATVSCEGTV